MSNGVIERIESLKDQQIQSPIVLDCEDCKVKWTATKENASCPQCKSTKSWDNVNFADFMRGMG